MMQKSAIKEVCIEKRLRGREGVVAVSPTTNYEPRYEASNLRSKQYHSQTWEDIAREGGCGHYEPHNTISEARS